MESRANKQEVMKALKRRKGTEIFMHHDLTKERKIQKKIRKIAKEESSKRENTKNRI